MKEGGDKEKDGRGEGGTRNGEREAGETCHIQVYIHRATISDAGQDLSLHLMNL